VRKEGKHRIGGIKKTHTGTVFGTSGGRHGTASKISNSTSGVTENGITGREPVQYTPPIEEVLRVKNYDKFGYDEVDSWIPTQIQ